MNRWSHPEGDVVDVDVIEYEETFKVCDECCDEFDLMDGGGIEEDDVFCEPCYNEIFGGVTHE